MAPLSAADLHTAFEQLSEELAPREANAHIRIVEVSAWHL